MCFLPNPKPKVPDAPTAPSELDAGITARRESRERQRAAASSGRSATVLTGSQGVANTSSTRKTLLGQ